MFKENHTNSKKIIQIRRKSYKFEENNVNLKITPKKGGILHQIQEFIRK